MPDCSPNQLSKNSWEWDPGNSGYKAPRNADVQPRLRATAFAYQAFSWCSWVMMVIERQLPGILQENKKFFILTFRWPPYMAAVLLNFYLMPLNFYLMCHSSYKLISSIWIPHLGFSETDARIQTFVLKGEVGCCQDSAFAGLPKRWSANRLHSLCFSLPGLRHLHVTGGKG